MFNDEGIVFPFLKTRSIILENTSVKVSGLISNKNFRTDDFDYTEFVKFYFIVAYGDSSLLLTADLQNPAARVRNTSTPAQEAILNWENYLEQGVIDSHIFEYKSLSMKEIIASTRERSMESILFGSAESDMFLDNHNELNFEVEIELSQANTFFEDWGLVGIPENQVSLICFGHLDLRHIASEYNIELYLSNLSQIGGNLTYDVLLNRDSNDMLSVPATRNIFYKTEEINFQGSPSAWLESNEYADHGVLEPYEGPTSYYSEEEPYVISPGPVPPRKTYAGWMSKPPGTLLTARGVLNRKVVSLLRYPGTSASGPSGFMGTDYPFDYSFYEPGSAAPGDMSFLKSVHDFFTDESQAKLNKKMREFSILSSRRGSLNIVDYDSKQTWIQVSPDQREYRPHHASFFSIKYEDLVRNNSPYGFFLYQWKNTSYVDEILKRCRILDFKIYRRRLTNDPVGNNAVLTNDYEYYDQNEEPTLLLLAKDFERLTGRSYNKKLIQLSGHNNTKVSEIDLADPQDNPGSAPPEREMFLRDFLIKDFQLAEKQYGKYTYILDITIKDGIKTYISQLLRRFQSSLEAYKELLHQSCIPSIKRKNSSIQLTPWLHEDRSSSPSLRPPGRLIIENQRDIHRANRDIVPDSPTPRRQQGNYNFFTKKFTLQFRNHVANTFTGSISDLVDDFVYLIRFINPTPELSMTPQELISLKSDLNPAENGTLEKMNRFYKECTKLESLIMKILLISPAGTDSDPTRQFDKRKSTIHSSSEYHAGTINVVADTKLVVDTYSGNTLFMELVDLTRSPGIFGFTDLLTSLNIENTQIQYPGESPLDVQADLSFNASGMHSIRPRSYMRFGFDGTPEKVITLGEYGALPVEKQKAASLSIKAATRRVESNRENMSFFSKHQAEAIGTNLSFLSGLSLSRPGPSSQVFSFALPSVLDEIANMFTEEDPTGVKTKRPPLSSDTAKKICNAAVTSDNKKHFLDNIKFYYKELTLSRENLGILFDKIVTKAQLYKDSFEITTPHKTWEKKLNFEEKVNPHESPAVNSSFADPFATMGCRIIGVKRGNIATMSTQDDPFFHGKGQKMVIIQPHAHTTQAQNENVRLVNNVFVVEN